MFVCACMCVWVCERVYLCVSAWVCRCACACIRVCSLRACMCARAFLFVCACLCVRVCSCPCMLVRACMFLCVHAHVCVCVRVCVAGRMRNSQMPMISAVTPSITVSRRLYIMASDTGNDSRTDTSWSQHPSPISNKRGKTLAPVTLAN